MARPVFDLVSDPSTVRIVPVGMRRWFQAVRAAVPFLQSAPRPAAHGLASDLERLFPDGAAIVFDVGAYIGEFAALTHRVFPNARVWCFEPFADSYERIRARFSEADWIQVEHIALSDRSGTADLILGEDRSTNSLVSPVVTKGVFKADSMRVAVPLTTLSACVRDKLTGDPHISILKIDTEGHDFAVLKGGEDLLRNRSIELIHIEVMFIEHFKGAASFIDICVYLHQFGYRLYSLYDLKRNPRGQLRYGNAVFLSPHRQAFAGIAR